MAEELAKSDASILEMTAILVEGIVEENGFIYMTAEKRKIGVREPGARLWLKEPRGLNSGHFSGSMNPGILIRRCGEEISVPYLDSTILNRGILWITESKFNKQEGVYQGGAIYRYEKRKEE